MIKPNFHNPEVHFKGWGREEWLVNNDKYCGKLLVFEKGTKFSMHYHLAKSETFYLLKGSVRLYYFDLQKAERLDREIFVGGCVDIPVGCPHQIEALEDSVVIEISSHHDDSDSYRTGKGNSQK